MLTLEPHPLLVVSAFTAQFRAPLRDSASACADLLRPDAPLPDDVQRSSDPLRAAIRDLLRHGGFKPTGRSKPASEYLIKAAAEGFLGSINAAVDACNVVSLHTGFPISVVDLDRVGPACGPCPDVSGLRIGLAPDDSEYVFNASGQTIDIGGLLCLFDAAGACANAVKDAQRTKTTPETRRTFSVIWGVRGYESAVAGAAAWYRSLLAGVADTAEVTASAP